VEMLKLKLEDNKKMIEEFKNKSNTSF